VFGKPSTPAVQEGEPLEREPTRHVARYLFPTEKFRGEWTRHWIHLVREFTVLALATVAFSYATGFLRRHHIPGLSTVALVAWAVVLMWVGGRVYEWQGDRFILTNRRIMLVTGVFTRRVAMMPLVRVTDMKYVQSPLGRILRYGTFEIESAGQDQALRRVANLPNPNELYLRMVEEMYEPEAVEARLGRREISGNGG
jgi:membrane protein YdbS with pleckstrin-like domain